MKIALLSSFGLERQAVLLYLTTTVREVALKVDWSRDRHLPLWSSPHQLQVSFGEKYKDVKGSSTHQYIYWKGGWEWWMENGPSEWTYSKHMAVGQRAQLEECTCPRHWRSSEISSIPWLVLCGLFTIEIFHLILFHVCLFPLIVSVICFPNVAYLSSLVASRGLLLLLFLTKAQILKLGGGWG